MVLDFGSILYLHSVVGGVVYCRHDIYGGTLPVLKNEIKDFFFARLGTGGIYDPPLQRRIQVYTIEQIIFVENVY